MLRYSCALLLNVLACSPQVPANWSASASQEAVKSGPAPSQGAPGPPGTQESPSPKDWKDNPLLRSPLSESDAPANNTPNLSDQRQIILAAINYPDFKNFGTKTPEDGTVLVLLMEGPSALSGLTRGSDRVVHLDEEACLRAMVTRFFEIKELKIEGESASLRYAYPVGAHFGKLSLKRTNGAWSVTKKEALRSSSGRRARLKAFYARIPRPSIPGGEKSPELLDACGEGNAESCKVYAIGEHQLGRLEAAELLYERACQLGDVESCHNLALLHVKWGKREQGLQELSRLCTDEGISLSCQLRDKYSEAELNGE